MHRKRRAALWLMGMIPCLGVAGYAIARYFVAPPARGHFSELLPLLQVHAGAGAVALLIGPWQFPAWLRNRHPGWHRWLGRVFLLAVAASSVVGLVLSFHSQEGWPTHLGFSLLAAIWFVTACMGYSTARERRFRVHREWMVRAFALALAAVTLRIELPLMLIAHVSFHAAYITVSWLCWVPNLIAAEWWLASTPGYISAPAVPLRH